jgi:hypothetical protein
VTWQLRDVQPCCKVLHHYSEVNKYNQVGTTSYFIKPPTNMAILKEAAVPNTLHIPLYTNRTHTDIKFKTKTWNPLLKSESLHVFEVTAVQALDFLCGSALCGG